MIVGIVGLLGQGKTQLAVRETGDLARRRGARLLSNIRVTVPGVECVQLGVGQDGLDLDELRDWVTRSRSEGRGLVVLLDEVGLLMPARFWQSFPIDLIMTLSQSRKMSIDVYWTAQDVEMCDAILRRLTQWVDEVRAIPPATVYQREKGRRPWLYRVHRTRPQDVGKPKERVGSRWMRHRREVEAWYDTDELVAPPARLTAPRGRSRRGVDARHGAAVGALMEPGTQATVQAAVSGENGTGHAPVLDLATAID